MALKLGSEASITEMVIKKLGFRTKLIDPIENLLNKDRIQARIPFIMELK